MANSIDYAKIYNEVLVNQYAILARTSALQSNAEMVKWKGGKEVEIPSLVTQGLGDVNGCDIPNGEYTFAYETKQLQWDRGRKFSLKLYDVDETGRSLTIERVLQSFSKQEVIPEIDKLRLSTIAKSAIDNGRVVYEGGSVSGTPLGDLLDDIGAMQNKIGEDKRIICYMSMEKKTAIMKSAEINKYLSVRETGGEVNTKIDYINEVAIIGVPSSYMYSAFNKNDGRTDGQKAGGLVVADGAKAINWILVAEGSCLAVGYPSIEKIITPDENQDSNCWKLIFEVYHGCFVFDKRADGLLVNVKGEAPSTNATITFNAGDGTGTMSPQTVVKNTATNLKACTFTAPDDKVFDKWTDGTNEYADEGSITISADVTLTATWKSPALTAKTAKKG